VVFRPIRIRIVVPYRTVFVLFPYLLLIIFVSSTQLTTIADVIRCTCNVIDIVNVFVSY